MAVSIAATLGTSTAGFEIIRYRKSVYVPSPYVDLLLGSDLTPIEAWQRVRGAIVNAAAEDACQPIVDWLRSALVRSGPNALSALRVPKPSLPLLDTLLLQNCHRLLLIHLTRLDPIINHAAVTWIAETVGEVAVELRETRLENNRVHENKERKGAAEYFGANLTHLLNRVQVTDPQDLPPVWEALARAYKHQQLLVLQRAFDGTAEEMGLRAPTIATPFLLKLVIALGFWMESRDDLTTGLHPFVLGQHRSTVRKFLCGQADRYSMVASGTRAPLLTYVEILSAPDGVTLPRNFSMARR